MDTILIRDEWRDRVVAWLRGLSPEEAAEARSHFEPVDVREDYRYAVVGFAADALVVYRPSRAAVVGRLLSALGAKNALIGLLVN